MSDETNAPASGSESALSDPGHLFDQTNGVAEGLDGDADGTAGSDAASGADRELDADTAGDGGSLLDDGDTEAVRGTEGDR